MNKEMSESVEKRAFGHLKGLCAALSARIGGLEDRLLRDTQTLMNKILELESKISRVDKTLGERLIELEGFVHHMKTRLEELDTEPKNRNRHAQDRPTNKSR
jgi:hypothetical protein